MSLSYELISEFSDMINKDTKNEAKTQNIYGTIAGNNVIIDGSTTPTPFIKGVSASEGERVLLTFKDHSLISIANITRG